MEMEGCPLPVSFLNEISILAACSLAGIIPAFRANCKASSLPRPAQGTTRPIQSI